MFQMHADAWGCPVMPPHGPYPSYPQVSLPMKYIVYALCTLFSFMFHSPIYFTICILIVFKLQTAAGFPNASVVDNNGLSMPQNSFELHPVKTRAL